MSLEGLEFLCEHFVICIPAYHHNKIKLSEQGHFISIESEPCVHPFFNDTAPRVSAQMLVVKDDIILYKHVLKLPFFKQKIPVLGVTCPVTASIIMAFSNIDLPSLYFIILRYLTAYKVKECLKIDLLATGQSFVDLRKITSVYKDAY